MSTLKTNKIQHLTSGFNNIITHTDGAGTVNAAHCRAWIQFNTITTTTITASFNVSSLTDHGSGDTTITFTNAMSDANYSAVSSNAGNSSYYLISEVFSSGVPVAPSAGSFRMTTFRRADGANDDWAYVSVAVFR